MVSKSVMTGYIVSVNDSSAGELKINLAENALERLDGEYVIISFTTGKYFSVNSTGSDLISMVAQNLPAETWKPLLQEHYDETEFPGILEFLEVCKAEGILVSKSDNSGDWTDGLPKDCTRGKWSHPALSIFDDLSDLLLVDPIHDSSTDGWPKQNTQ